MNGAAAGAGEAFPPLRPRGPRRKDRSRDRDARSVQEVATVDLPVHAQLTIALLHFRSPQGTRGRPRKIQLHSFRLLIIDGTSPVRHAAFASLTLDNVVAPRAG